MFVVDRSLSHTYLFLFYFYFVTKGATKFFKTLPPPPFTVLDIPYFTDVWTLSPIGLHYFRTNTQNPISHESSPSRTKQGPLSHTIYRGKSKAVDELYIL